MSAKLNYYIMIALLIFVAIIAYGYLSVGFLKFMIYMFHLLDRSRLSYQSLQ